MMYTSPLATRPPTSQAENPITEGEDQATGTEDQATGTSNFHLRQPTLTEHITVPTRNRYQHQPISDMEDDYN